MGTIEKSSRILTFDPGVNTGWACFANTKLTGAGLISFEEGLPEHMASELPTIDAAQNVIIEKPLIYDRKQWQGDPNDLITVALIGGFCAGLEFRDMYSSRGCYRDIKYVHPQTWKGGRPKDVDNKYTLSVLFGNEKAILKDLGLPKNKLHNVIDAVGIGLWAVGRR